MWIIKLLVLRFDEADNYDGVDNELSLTTYQNMYRER